MTSVSFLDFLKETSQEFRQIQREHAKSPPHVVIGNEAGDADSIVSALTYAYIASIPGSSSTQSPKRTPLVSIPREDLLTQRPETTVLLELAGLTTDDMKSNLLFVDDVITDEDNVHTNTKGSSVTLMDHNALSDKFHSGEWKVVEILDHHVDMGQHIDTCPDRSHIAFADEKALVASTCTLVAEQWLEQQQSPSSTTSKPLSPAVSILLLGTIVLDSVNMAPHAGKGTERDARAMQALMENTDWSTLSSTNSCSSILSKSQDDDSIVPDTNQLFQALQNAKFDAIFWNQLSVRNALRLDYKAFIIPNSHGMVLGLSTVLLPWKDVAQKKDLWSSIQHYMQVEAKVHVLGLMMTSTTDDGTFQRELLLCEVNNNKSKDNQSNLVLNPLIEQLMAPQSDENTVDLQLVEYPDSPLDTTGSDLTVRLFHQGNAKASRKQVAPILIQRLESLATSKL